MDNNNVCEPLAIAGALFTFSMDEDDVLIVEGMRKQSHHFWMFPFLRDQTDMAQRNMFSKLHRGLIRSGEEEEFKHTLRMSPGLYQELLDMIYPLVYRQTTNYHKPITPAERLDITLQYLALGDCATTLHHGNLVGHAAVLPIIRDTCDPIYTVLRLEYMQVPNTEAGWLAISEGYRDNWQLPHMLGAVDGKHVRIRKPFWNYKNVFLASVDAHYRFVFVDIILEGRARDSRIWKEFQFFHDFHADNNPLNIPTPSKVVGIHRYLPYYFVVDDAFMLSSSMMKPYSSADPSHQSAVFNYRLCRGRRVVENSFGILATRFRLFRCEQDMEPPGVKKVVMVACSIHNYLHTCSDMQYMPHGSIDWEDKNHDVHDGEWRQEFDSAPLDRAAIGRNANDYANTVLLIPIKLK